MSLFEKPKEMGLTGRITFHSRSCTVLKLGFFGKTTKVTLKKDPPGNARHARLSVLLFYGTKFKATGIVIAINNEL